MSEALLTVRQVGELALFLRIYNGTFSTLALIVEAAMITMIVINTSMAVKYFALRESMRAAIACALCIALFKTMGRVDENSRDIYGTISNSNLDSAFLRRCRKAYRPLRIDIGAVGYAEMILCLTILSTILQNTVNLVMTTG